jgi:hypothetical protein
MADLSGTWLGTYWQNSQPTRFEAALIQSGNSLSGNILDDGELGEARLAGEIVGKHLRFSKQYFCSPYEPIDYTGSIVGDAEDAIQGIWQIAGTKQSGNWEAKRNGNELMQQLQNRIEQTITVGVS